MKRMMFVIIFAAAFHGVHAQGDSFFDQISAGLDSMAESRDALIRDVKKAAGMEVDDAPAIAEEVHAEVSDIEPTPVVEDLAVQVEESEVVNQPAAEEDLSAPDQEASVSVSDTDAHQAIAPIETVAANNEAVVEDATVISEEVVTVVDQVATDAALLAAEEASAETDRVESVADTPVTVNESMVAQPTTPEEVATAEGVSTSVESDIEEIPAVDEPADHVAQAAVDPESDATTRSNLTADNSADASSGQGAEDDSTASQGGSDSNSVPPKKLEKQLSDAVKGAETPEQARQGIIATLESYKNSSVTWISENPKQAALAGALAVAVVAGTVYVIYKTGAVAKITKKAKAHPYITAATLTSVASAIGAGVYCYMVGMEAAAENVTNVFAAIASYSPYAPAQ